MTIRIQLPFCTGKPKCFSDDSQRARDITESLAKMIIMDLQPVSNG